MIWYSLPVCESVFLSRKSLCSHFLPLINFFFFLFTWYLRTRVGWLHWAKIIMLQERSTRSQCLSNLKSVHSFNKMEKKKGLSIFHFSLCLHFFLCEYCRIIFCKGSTTFLLVIVLTLEWSSLNYEHRSAK